MRRAALTDYVTLARPSYWVKSVFILPGTIAAVLFGLGPVPWDVLALSVVATSLVSSANYVLNGWLDAVSDARRPSKHDRPAALGNVKAAGVVLEYLALAASGLAIGLAVSPLTCTALLVMLIMGAAYNVPPIRLKDRAYVDVLSESVNDAVRLLVGWFALTSVFLPPSSLVLGYWMGSAFLMSVKRLAECRAFADRVTAEKYRRSFGHYTTERLMVLALVCAMAASFFLGVFLVRYRYEYLLAMPAIWALFGWYLALGFREGSDAQRPEVLWREVPLLALTALVVGALVLLTFVDVPAMARLSDTSLIRIPAYGTGR